MGARDRVAQGYRTGPPGYIGWRNSFLGIDSWALQSFKNTGSVFDISHFVDAYRRTERPIDLHNLLEIQIFPSQVYPLAELRQIREGYETLKGQCHEIFCFWFFS